MCDHAPPDATSGGAFKAGGIDRSSTKQVTSFDFQNIKTSIFASVFKRMPHIHKAISLPFLLAFAFSALPTTAASACNKGAGCCNNEAVKVPKTCSEAYGDRSGKNGCGGDCGNQDCPCPHPAPNALSALPTDHFQTPTQLPLVETRSKADWYYLNKIPAAVYLSVWLLPKI